MQKAKLASLLAILPCLVMIGVGVNLTFAQEADRSHVSDSASVSVSHGSIPDLSSGVDVSHVADSASVSVIPTASAQTPPSGNDQNAQTIQLGITEGSALVSGGVGALAGIVMTIVTTVNANLTNNTTQKVSPREFFILLGIGFLVGVGLSVLGINVPNNPTLSTSLVALISMMVNYAGLHWTHMILRPLFSHWAGAFRKTTTDSSVQSSAGSTKPPGQI